MMSRIHIVSMKPKLEQKLDISVWQQLCVQKVISFIVLQSMYELILYVDDIQFANLKEMVIAWLGTPC